MDIPIRAKLSCSDGPCGYSVLVIIKPATHAMTHLVISDASSPETEYLVAVHYIRDSTPARIWLNCSRKEFSEMPVFARDEFIPYDEMGFYGGPSILWPYFPLAAPYVMLEKEHMPTDQLAIRKGTEVKASDGHLGNIDEFLIDLVHDQITDLVVREGHLWKTRHLTIPVDQIDHYQENAIYLKLSRQAANRLPDFPMQRG